MADADDDDGGEPQPGSVRSALDQCALLQNMIDINAGHLDGLRTQCATRAELTQKEIRTLEGKLIKLFSCQLLAKAEVKERCAVGLERYPQLRQWLHVVGLNSQRVQEICQRVSSLEELMKMPERDTRQIVRDHGGKEEEERRLISALHNLKKYTECQLYMGNGGSCSEIELHWDSWDHSASPPGGPCSSPHPVRPSANHRNATSSSSSEDVSQTIPQQTAPPWSPLMSSLLSSAASAPTAASASSGLSQSYSGLATPAALADRRFTPPPTPPTAYKKGDKIKFTPPPNRRNRTIIDNSLLPEAPPLTKSWSHEFQLANRVDQGDGSNYEQLPPRRTRLLTEPGPEQDDHEEALGLVGHVSPNISPIHVVPYQSSEPLVAHPFEETNHRFAQISAPVSPRLAPPSGVMTHIIQHRFTTTLKVTSCDYCQKQMFLGFKCKECKFKCHRDCAEKVPPSCGLPQPFLEWFMKSIAKDGSHSPAPVRTPMWSPPKDGVNSHWDRRRLHNQPAFPAADSSSNTSSCNSSAPSSPAIVASQTPPVPSRHQFHFPEINSQKGITLATRPLTETSEMVETQKSNDSDKTVSGTSGSTDSEKTLAGRVDSQDSQISDVDSADRNWPSQKRLSFREWEISFDELVIGDAVGTGRFGTVFKGNWHGDVAVKVFNMDQMDDDKTLDAFKQEVATFRKTRHENLVLFMGACMKPPHLAIVTRLCKGLTLYTHIHLRRDRFNLNKAVIIAQQISQGMGYLHARGIVHKDLKAKNIFLENGKVVITDFGLVSVTKLCHGNRKGEWLTIPPGWLCYLAPEIVCSLRASHSNENDLLPFTAASDIYAFGTVWYELLSGEWPFKGQPPEAIIWQVGRGIKQSLVHIQTSRDVKDILVACWSYQALERTDFGSLLKLLEKLPKKRLARSPSHPIHLSRSAESVF